LLNYSLLWKTTGFQMAQLRNCCCYVKTDISLALSSDFSLTVISLLWAKLDVSPGTVVQRYFAKYASQKLSIHRQVPRAPTAAIQLRSSACSCSQTFYCWTSRLHVTGLRLWNDLPSDFISLPSLFTRKHRL